MEKTTRARDEHAEGWKGCLDRLVKVVLVAGEAEAMITMYHPDGGELVATHYCAAGNQPRLRLRSAGDPGMLDLEMTGSGLDSSAFRPACKVRRFQT